MIRTLLVLTGLFSTVILLAEVLAAGVLWSRGHLTPTTLREIRLAIAQPGEAVAEETPETTAAEEISAEEVRQARVKRVLDLDSRETELTTLKRLTTEAANQLISERRAFDQLKDDFRKELEALAVRTRDEATEQTRAVLLAVPPEEAVQRLLGLTKDEAVDLLRGMPEKSIARLLSAFERDPKAIQRGQELFEALYRGRPTQPTIDKAREGLDPGAAPQAARGG